MNPPDAPQPGTASTAHNPLSTLRPNEQTVCEIKRHPIGMFGVYLVVGFLLLLLAVAAFIIAPRVFSGYSESRIIMAGLVLFVIAVAIGIGFLLIISKIYWDNMWIVTDDSITQITRTSLFDKQTSQLSLGNLEDITADQDGILAQMFHFGVISAETAAATDKFTFHYCPNPTYYAQKILTAREQFEQGRHDVAAPAPQPATAAVTASPSHDLGVTATSLAQNPAATPGKDWPGPGQTAP